MSVLDEPSAFIQLNNALDLAADAAKQLSLLRDDHRWGTIASLLIDMKSKCFELKLRGASQDIPGLLR